MRILYIIGNGFDLNQGLNTGYKDFINYYREVNSDCEIINKLKRDISNNVNSWCDLEIELGKYTLNVKKPEDFIKIHEDIGDRLADFLQREELTLDKMLVSQDKFLDDIWNPHRYLTNREQEFIKELFNQNDFMVGTIDIVTLNYTNTIERILKNVSLPKSLNNDFNSNLSLESIIHIHGYIDSRMILGVNDFTQILNKDFHMNEDIVRAFVKNECNIANESNVETEFSNLIMNSDIVCIFGSSIGETDAIWWEMIGNQIITNKLVLIVFIKHSEDLSLRRPYKQVKIKDEYKNLIIKKMRINHLNLNDVLNNIIISLNMNFMKVTSKQQKSNAPMPISLNNS